MNKKMCIAGKIHSGESIITDYFGKELTVKPKLPEGCVGMSLVFESKKAAKNYYGNLLKEKNIFTIEYDKN